jgi:hypothetical protein
MRDSVVIVRQQDYDDVFTRQIDVPPNLQQGLYWIQDNCPIDEPTSVRISELAIAWDVPEIVIALGLRTLQRTGFFTLLEERP